MVLSTHPAQGHTPVIPSCERMENHRFDASLCYLGVQSQTGLYIKILKQKQKQTKQKPHVLQKLRKTLPPLNLKEDKESLPEANLTLSLLTEMLLRG